MYGLLDDLAEYLPQIRKALVGGAVVLVLSLLNQWGVDENISVGDAVRLAAEALVGGALVWLIPNSKK